MSDTTGASPEDGGSSMRTTPPASNTPQHHAGGDANFVKVTRGHSCVLCQSRKVRCDKTKPCSNCVRAGVECRVIPPQPPRRRKKRIPERDLVERLKKYEALLTQAGIKFDGLGPDVKITDPGTAQEGDELDTDFVKIKDSPSGLDPDLISSPGETPHVPRSFKWVPLHKEFRNVDELLRDSSDEDDIGISINQAYDKVFENSDGFPFIVGPASQSVTNKHPPAIQIFQLWQEYLNNVNPLLKLTHAPSLQGRIIEASANLDKVSKSLEALMFAIYFMAVTSLRDEEVQESFNSSRAELLQKYYLACQQALLNAGFMRTPDLTLLQAYLLYLMGIRSYVDPRTLFCLSGIGVRLAHRLGLHRDGAQFGLSPFEVEERRRLWWAILGFDRRLGEMTGSTITAISNGGDCKLPLNINDADLHLHAKDPPKAHTGTTEMLFALTRHEFAKAPGSDKMRPVLTDTTQVPNLADYRLGSYIEKFSIHMEDMYLKYCDPKIPIQFLTLMMARQNICKFKVLSGFFRLALSTPAPISAAEEEGLFIEAIKWIEYDSMVQANESLKGYLWYTQMHFPFPAYICLVRELRNRTTGELCERAWHAILENHDLRKMNRKSRSPMHMAYAPLFVKAWDAREAAEANLGRTLAPPPLITALRQAVARMPKSKYKTPEPAQQMQQTQGPVNAFPPTSTTTTTTTMNADPLTTAASQPTATADTQMQLYPDSNLWAGVPGLDVNRQYANAFADVNFGGEVDWQYLMSEYSGMPVQPEMANWPTDPQGNSMWWQ